ncbi:septation protein IspZ, partial [Escherichia coli]|uniref:septation protein IspZ n=1 Tax=Escherichia coli TaxID=562 RepID=UPI00273A4C74
MTADQKKPDAAAGKSNSIVKLLVELGPLVAFFAAYGRAGIYWATGILMIATVVALIASWRMLGRI